MKCPRLSLETISVFYCMKRTLILLQIPSFTREYVDLCQ